MTSARAILSQYLAKSAGEGSRGGHIIGHSASGAPIYASHRAESAQYAGYTPRDHASAAMAHDFEADKAEDPKTAAHHKAMADSHRAYHAKAADRFHAASGGKAKTVGYGMGQQLPEDKPTAQDSHAIGQTFTGRKVWAGRHAHQYDQATASEHGDMARAHAAAAARARDAGQEDARKHHEEMRYRHVQAAQSASRAEAKLRGQEDWRNEGLRRRRAA